MHPTKSTRSVQFHQPPDRLLDNLLSTTQQSIRLSNSLDRLCHRLHVHCSMFSTRFLNSPFWISVSNFRHHYLFGEHPPKTNQTNWPTLVCLANKAEFLCAALILAPVRTWQYLVSVHSKRAVCVESTLTVTRHHWFPALIKITQKKARLFMVEVWLATIKIMKMWLPQRKTSYRATYKIAALY